MYYGASVQQVHTQATGRLPKARVLVSACYVTYNILWINYFHGMLYWVIQARGWEIVRKI